MCKIKKNDVGLCDENFHINAHQATGYGKKAMIRRMWYVCVCVYV